MHRLTDMVDSPGVYELLQRLEAAGIAATMVREPTVRNVYSGGAPRVVIHVHDAADLEAAGALVREFHDARVHELCPACGYDFTGLEGPIACPECGQAVRAAAPERPCDACGAPVPGDFQVCWRCGAELDADGTVIDGDDHDDADAHGGDDDLDAGGDGSSVTAHP